MKISINTRFREFFLASARSGNTEAGRRVVQVDGGFVEKGKWKRLLRYPLYMLAMYYLRFRVAMAYVQNKATLYIK